MRPDERDAAYLWHMLGAAREAQRSMADADFEEYLRDRDLQAMTERRLEIIGEAARGVSREFWAAHPEIPWRAIIGQRNIIAHMYYELRQREVWDSATAGVAELIALLEPLVPPPPPDPDPD